MESVDPTEPLGDLMKTTRSRIARRTTIAALLSSLALVGVSATADSATATSREPKPTVVLVHGAWADASGFQKVEDGLHRAGYPVLEWADPLRSLTDDSATLATFLKVRTQGPVILVGHSYGGAVITNAATGDPNVKALVYIDAFVPAQGETLNDLINSNGPIDAAALFDFVPYAGGGGDVDLYLKGSVFSTVFANGLPKPEQDRLYAAQRPLANKALNEKSGAPAWSTIPSWYVVGTNDHIIPAALQELMAKRAGSHVTTVDAGHLSFIARPDVVVNTILQAARATH
jgi:pimeloyl-ACP methyl ester carboxylesterase